MEQKNKNWIFQVGAIILILSIIGFFWTKPETDVLQVSAEEIIPEESILPVIWGDLGKRLVESGAIGEEKFKAFYESRGEFSEEYEKLLSGTQNGEIKITKENSGYILNLFWALGLANKNKILDEGPMNNPEYGNPGRFASTGGWNLSVGDSMDHYSRHNLIALTPEQQNLVEEVSKNIYRPCCGNSTYFPDCNHGMAMLALLELMASQGMNEEEMYQTALLVNSYWFPETYLTIADHLAFQGIDWKDVSAKELLGFEYSSGAGYGKIAAEVQKRKGVSSGGASCGV